MKPRLFHAGDRVKRYKYGRNGLYWQKGKVLGTVNWGFEDETVEWYYVLWAGRKTVDETDLSEINRV